MKKIELIHPITHDGKEFDRGVHELDDDTAKHFLATAPHAAIPFKAGELRKGNVTESADAGSGDEIALKAAELYAGGATIKEVATELNISQKAAAALRPKQD